MGVLLSCTDSQIIFSVVQAVVVYVVADKMFRGIHYFSVHPDLVARFASNCIIST